jgi:hypothetical protein
MSRRRLSRLALFAFAGLVLLMAVSETASGQDGRLPRELWNEYPLDPVKGEMDPALGGADQLKTRRESQPTRTRAANADGRSLFLPLVAGIGGAAVLLLMAAGAALRVRKDWLRQLASLRPRGAGTGEVMPRAKVATPGSEGDPVSESHPEEEGEQPPSSKVHARASEAIGKKTVSTRPPPKKQRDVASALPPWKTNRSGGSPPRLGKGCGVSPFAPKE